MTDPRISEYWEETPNFMFGTPQWGVRLNGHKEKTFRSPVRPDQLDKQAVDDLIAVAERWEV